MVFIFASPLGICCICYMIPRFWWLLDHLVTTMRCCQTIPTFGAEMHANQVDNYRTPKSRIYKTSKLSTTKSHTTKSLTCNLKIMPWKTKRHTSTRCMFGTSGNSHSLGWSKDQVSPLNHLQSGWSQMGMDRELYKPHKRDVVNNWNLNGVNICHICIYIFIYNNIPKKTHAKSTA